MKMRSLLFTAFLAMAVSGCTTTYVPSPGIPNVKLVPDFPAGTRVALVNAQSATNIVLLAQHPNGSTYYANLHDWTERLVESISKTLKKKKVAVDPTAPKVMKLSIEKANVHPKSTWAFQCDMEWKIELSNGKVVPMSVEEGHWKVEDCSNVAVRRACLLTLSNDTVRGFLSAP